MATIASSPAMEIFEVLLYLYHLSVLILLIAKRKVMFKGAFYHIFRIVLVADLTYYVVLKATQKLAYLDAFSFLFYNNPYFASFRFNFLAFLSAIQFYGHTFMAMNRFTIIWFPLRHQPLWKKQWYIPLMFLLSFIQVCWRLHEPGTFVVAPDNGSYTFLNSAVAQAIAVSTGSILYITTTVIAAILNILSIIKFYLQKNIASSNVNVNEKRLLFVSFVIFIAQLLRTLCTVLRSLFPNDAILTAVIATALPILSNTFAWSGSVSLLLLSPTTRKEYLSFYLCKKNLQTDIITISSKTNKPIPVT